MAVHYRIAAEYKPNAHLIGSNTMKKGLELYGQGIASEEKSDFEKPEKDNSLPYWVIPDTLGSLLGLLHPFRRFEFCRDVIVLVSESTPKRYLDYLRKRNYDNYVVGQKHIDLKKSLALLARKYKATTILADTGRILSNLLLDQRLVSEISLVVHPVIVGRGSYHIFGDIRNDITLQLRRCRKLKKEYAWLVYTLSG